MNAAAIGLMAAVAIQLGGAAVVDELTVALAIGAGIALVWGRIPSVLLVMIGAVVGIAGGALGIGP